MHWIFPHLMVLVCIISHQWTHAHTNTQDPNNKGLTPPSTLLVLCSSSQYRNNKKEPNQRMSFRVSRSSNSKKQPYLETKLRWDHFTWFNGEQITATQQRLKIEGITYSHSPNRREEEETRVKQDDILYIIWAKNNHILRIKTESCF